MSISYQDYQEMLSNVNSGLEKMERICEKLGMEEKQNSLAQSRKKMAEHKFSVGILGEFKRGKSTVINSLLEKEIIPADILPTTATMNRITYGLQPHAEVVMKDGSIKNIEVDELADYVTMLDEHKEAMAAWVEEAIVYYPSKFCQNGVDIIDTPGLNVNDDEWMNKVTEEIIPKLDAVIMVLVTTSPFCKSEAEFVCNKIMTSELGKIIFLVNKMDLLRSESDKQRLLDDIKDGIKMTILDKMEEIYGKDSKEYEDVQVKLGNIQVYPFSARDALDGKIDGDQRLIEKSGTIEFEQALMKILTEDRGALELCAPLELLAEAVTEAVQLAKTRKNALELSQQQNEYDEIIASAVKLWETLEPTIQKVHSALKEEHSTHRECIWPGRKIQKEELKMSNQYQGYQEMVINVNSGLEKMERICEKLGMEEKQNSLAQSRRKMAEHKFSVGILGEFKRGKSTVINSLLEKEIIPADILPTSATMNRITYGLQPHAEVVMKDGNIKNIEVDELADYVTKLDEHKEAMAARVEEAIVYYPCKFCQNGVDIIDTPGLNDDERMNKVTEEIIPKLDAVIMVLVTTSPFSMSEAEFVRNKIMTSELGKIIFLVNKIDMIRREGDKQRLLDDIKDRIKKTILDKMEEIYGKDSKEYEDVLVKLGDIQVYPFSALDALDGKIDGDQSLIEKSGTKEFEQALTKMLTEDRGALELCGPLGLLAGTVTEAVQLAKTRKNALELSQKQFEEEKKQAMEAITQIRTTKKEEIRKLRQEVITLSAELNQETVGFYDRMQDRLYESIDQYPINTENLGNTTGKQQVSQQMTDTIFAQIEQEMCNFTEKIQMQVQNRLKEHSDRLSLIAMKEASGLAASLPGAHAIDSDEGVYRFIKDVAFDVATDFAGVVGVGGAMAGYRAAGVKGLLVGGGVSAAATLMMIAALPMTGIPLMVVTAAAGTALGKKTVKSMFHRDIEYKESVKIRSNMKNTVKTYVEERKSEHTLEKWIQDLVTYRFNQLITTFEEESNRMMDETERTIDEIKKDLTTNELTRKQKAAEYDEIIASAVKLWETLEPTNQKVRSALKGGA